MILYKQLINLFVVILFFAAFSCKKMVDVDSPSTQITSDNVYDNDASAIAVLNGIYSTISRVTTYESSVTIPSLSMWAGLSADELALWNNASFASQKAYYKNTLSANVTGSEFWINTYGLIYRCNVAIEGLAKSSALTPAIKQQLLSEAKFLRAFFYFYLVNLYGDVPLTLTIDYTVNATLARTSKDKVYEQIVADLIEAKNQLSDGYLKANLGSLYSSGSAERIRPTKAAASALLARVYLYTGDWAKAEGEATAVINNTAVYDTVPLNKVFLKNSKEAIWQLQPVNSGVISNTADGVLFNPSISPTGINSSHPVYLSTSLLNVFEPNDQRKVIGNWVNVFTNASGTYYYSYKYKVGTANAPVTEYIMMLRLGEQYLIRAEARARKGDINGATSDLNVIRKRAGLSNTTANDQPSLLTAILQERRVELFTELGHRWLDLKRAGKVDAVMTSEALLKGTIWHSYQQLYPVPPVDILKDPNLDQNPEYN